MILPSFQFTNGDKFQTPAEAYMWLTKTFAIPACQTAQGLRDWWTSKEETNRRIEYGLTREQEDELVALCKARIEELAASPEPDQPQPAPKKKAKAKTKRRAAI